MPPFLRFLLFVLFIHLTKSDSFAQDTLKFRKAPVEKLNHPFGTVLKLQVEIFDGDKLNNKFHQGSYLFKIKSVDSVLLTTPILMEFRDETLFDYFPTQDFELYNYFYGVDTGVLTNKDVKKIKKEYVGQEFTIAGYESGEFFGTPKGVFNYRVISSTPFHFRHYIIIVAKLSESDWFRKNGSLKK